jgi:hypothetical protein
MDYYVMPAGGSSTPLMDLLLEVDSPGAKILKEMGASSHVFNGLPGWLLGEFFYTADPTAINGLLVMGYNVKFTIDMPVTRIYVGSVRVLFINDDEETTLEVNRESFKLEVGNVPNTSNGAKYRTKSPW